METRRILKKFDLSVPWVTAWFICPMSYGFWLSLWYFLQWPTVSQKIAIREPAINNAKKIETWYKQSVWFRFNLNVFYSEKYWKGLDSRFRFMVLITLIPS
jgi:hypothetical protein